MDPRIFQQAERVRAYTSRGVTFVRRSRSPLETLLMGVAAVVMLAVFLVLFIPFLVLATAAALGIAAYLGLRRMLTRATTPNGHIGPVRTDGRSNVRVIERDGP